jgi:hypothetical protein
MRKLLLISLFCVSAFSSNLSENYLKTRKGLNPNHDRVLRERLKDVTVVFLPGILSETAIDGSRQPLNFSLIVGDYFKDSMKWLTSQKIKNERIIVESEDTVDNNSKYIAKELRKIKGDVVVISHSKGGVEFLNVLLENEDIRKKTRGWIAMQTPFYGAYIADFFADTSIINIGTKWVFSFFGGSIDGLKSLSPSVLVKFQRKNKSSIKEALKGINFLQYVTYIENEFGPESPLESVRDLISLKKGRNDGLVEVSTAYIPFGNYIIEDGVDHLATVLNFKNVRLLPRVINRYKNWRFDRVAHTKALLYLNVK